MFWTITSDYLSTAVKYNIYDAESMLMLRKALLLRKYLVWFGMFKKGCSYGLAF